MARAHFLHFVGDADHALELPVHRSEDYRAAGGFESTDLGVGGGIDFDAALLHQPAISGNDDPVGQRCHHTPACHGLELR
jgi:hypothetical protein